MTDITEPDSPVYPAGIYQIETQDVVAGGEDGIANKQAAQLARRTNWLKHKVDQIIENLQLSLVPRGVVTAWYGDLNQLPTGWYVCDGENGTPNLRGRFIIGADLRTSEYAPDATGGSSEITPAGKVTVEVQPHTLTQEEMPLHRHSSGWYGPRSASGQSRIFASNQPGDGNVNTGWAGGSKAHKHGATGNFKGTAQDNRPAFRALLYIMKPHTITTE